jgi:hypothetical protein
MAISIGFCKKENSAAGLGMDQSTDGGLEKSFKE